MSASHTEMSELDRLRYAFQLVDEQIEASHSMINRITWNLSQLADKRSDLLKAIAERTIVVKPTTLKPTTQRTK